MNSLDQLSRAASRYLNALTCARYLSLIAGIVAPVILILAALAVVNGAKGLIP